MIPLEEAAHIRVLLRAGDISERRALVQEIQERAIERLSRLVVLVPRNLSAEIRQAYEAKEWDLSWNLLDPEDAGEFCISAPEYQPSVDEQSAIQLLSVCASARRDGEIGPTRQEWIADAYAALSLQNAQTGAAHRNEQGRRASLPRNPMAEITEDLMRQHGTDATATDLWPHLFAALNEMMCDPAEIVARDQVKSHYEYTQENGNLATISRGRFAAVISRVRKKISSIARLSTEGG